VDVDRLCRLRVGSDLDDTPFGLDEHGFLDTPGWYSPRRRNAGELIDPVALSGRQSFALLGEPGSGKTFVLKRIEAHWAERLGASNVFHVNAIDMTDDLYESMVGSILAGLPPRDDANVVEPELIKRVVIIDQLDESPALKSLAARFELTLRDRRTAELRLILACRQMNYPPALDARLRLSCLFGAADLAPLTRGQAIALADAKGVSGEALTRAATVRGVAPLASVPLTLLMLCDMFESDGDLVGTPVEIFRRAVSLFADQMSDPSIAADALSALGRDQRLAIGRRLAAQLLLTGRRNVWTGNGAAPRVTDLDLGSAAGGFEGPESARFEVTQHLVKQTLGCAFFAGTGGGRIAFRHSSIAAFLAAEHLLDHQVPEGQLRQLLLVEQSFGDTWLTIPTPLRELAAWLIALAPQRSSWLLAADPLSLAAHSALVDSDDARQVLVASLIRSADDAYLSDSWWTRRGSFRLTHPGLGIQVREALNASGSDGWRSRARLQLLLELAREAEDPVLGDTLRKITFADTHDARVRRLAVQAFVACCPDRVEEVTELLDGLRDSDYASRVDPDDEFRSALLGALWPAHMSAESLLSSLTPRRNTNLYGGYALFLWSVAAREASDEQVGELLTLLAEQVATESSDTETITAASEPSECASNPRSRAVINPEVGREFVAALVDRALAGPFAFDLLPTIAQVLAPFLSTSISLEVPASLDESRSRLPAAEATARRRSLAAALAEQIRDDYPNYSAHTILSGWHAKTELLFPGLQRVTWRGALLDSDDFGWLAEGVDRSLDTNRTFGLVLAELAGLVLDTTNPDDYELAYELFERIGPEAETIASLFTAMSVDSWAARASRRHRDDESAADESWDGADGFAIQARQLLARVESGSPELFWQLAYQLQFDPRTGKGHDPTFNDDLLTYPGIPVLGPGGPDRLRAAALAYLSHEDDQRTGWLGTGEYGRRAWAGYLALCIVERDAGILSDVPWERWVGAIIWYLAESESDAADRHTRLLRAAADAAPDAFGEAFALFVKNTLERGGVPYGIDTVGTVMRPELGQSLLTVLRSVRAAIERRSDADIVIPRQDNAEGLAVQVWRDLASLLIHAEVDGSVDEARAALAFQEGSAPTPLALAAAAVLMSTEPSSAWPTIRDDAGTDPVTARPIVYAIAHQNYYGVNLTALDDDDLVAFYLWLRELLPTADDINVHGAHWVGEHEEAQRLRGHTLEAVSQRSTVRVLELLRAAIATEDAIELASAERRIRSQLAEIDWATPEVAELAEIIENPMRRLVRSDAELARLLVETLRDIADRIPTHGDLLWDRIPTVVASAAKQHGIQLRHPGANPHDDLWSPKTESALSGYLANQLELLLVKRRVVVNREVLIKPTNAYGAGDRTDLLVQVRHHSAAPCIVPIEIKGNWNDGVEASITTQLADRYLPEAGAKAGIYAVGWWAPEQWTVKESGRSAAASRSAPQMSSALAMTAAELSRSRGVSITPFVLPIPRPARSTATGPT
jgi:hypothetical protein